MAASNTEEGWGGTGKWSWSVMGGEKHPQKKLDHPRLLAAGGGGIGIGGGGIGIGIGGISRPPAAGSEAGGRSDVKGRRARRRARGRFGRVG